MDSSRAEALMRLVEKRGLDPRLVYATPFAWIEVEKLLGAVSSPLNVKARLNPGVKGLVRELALTLTALLTSLGLRADVSEVYVSVEGRRTRIVYVNLLDCDCKVTATGKQGYVVVRCTRCPELGEISYRVAIDVEARD